MSLQEFLRLYNIEFDEIEKYAFIANPHLTLLLPNGDNGRLALSSNSEELQTSSSLMKAAGKPHTIYGYVGLAVILRYGLGPSRSTA